MSSRARGLAVIGMALWAPGFASGCGSLAAVAQAVGTATVTAATTRSADVEQPPRPRRELVGGEWWHSGDESVEAQTTRTTERESWYLPGQVATAAVSRASPGETWYVPGASSREGAAVQAPVESASVAAPVAGPARTGPGAGPWVLIWVGAGSLTAGVLGVLGDEDTLGTVGLLLGVGALAGGIIWYTTAPRGARTAAQRGPTWRIGAAPTRGGVGLSYGLTF